MADTDAESAKRKVDSEVDEDLARGADPSTVVTWKPSGSPGAFFLFLRADLLTNGCPEHLCATTLRARRPKTL